MYAPAREFSGNFCTVSLHFLVFRRVGEENWPYFTIKGANDLNFGYFGPKIGKDDG